MGLLSGIGAKVRGLLGDDAFLDHLAQAQAFANGDPMAPARIGQNIREWRAMHPKASGIPPTEPTAAAAILPGHDKSWIRPSDPNAAPLQIGQRIGRFSYAGGHPNSRSSWRPIGGFFGGNGYA